MSSNLYQRLGKVSPVAEPTKTVSLAHAKSHLSTAVRMPDLNHQITDNDEKVEAISGKKIWCCISWWMTMKVSLQKTTKTDVAFIVTVAILMLFAVWYTAQFNRQREMEEEKRLQALNDDSDILKAEEVEKVQVENVIEQLKQNQDQQNQNQQPDQDQDKQKQPKQPTEALPTASDDTTATPLPNDDDESLEDDVTGFNITFKPQKEHAFLPLPELAQLLLQSDDVFKTISDGSSNSANNLDGWLTVSSVGLASSMTTTTWATTAAGHEQQRLFSVLEQCNLQGSLPSLPEVNTSEAKNGTAADRGRVQRMGVMASKKYFSSYLFIGGTGTPLLAAYASLCNELVAGLPHIFGHNICPSDEDVMLQKMQEHFITALDEKTLDESILRVTEEQWELMHNSSANASDPSKLGAEKTAFVIQLTRNQTRLKQLLRPSHHGPAVLGFIDADSNMKSTSLNQQEWQGVVHMRGIQEVLWDNTRGDEYAVRMVKDWAHIWKYFRPARPILVPVNYQLHRRRQPPVATQKQLDAADNRTTVLAFRDWSALYGQGLAALHAGVYAAAPDRAGGDGNPYWLQLRQVVVKEKQEDQEEVREIQFVPLPIESDALYRVKKDVDESGGLSWALNPLGGKNRKINALNQPLEWWTFIDPTQKYESERFLTEKKVEKDNEDRATDKGSILESALAPTGLHVDNIMCRTQSRVSQTGVATAIAAAVVNTAAERMKQVHQMSPSASGAAQTNHSESSSSTEQDENQTNISYVANATNMTNATVNMTDAMTDAIDNMTETNVATALPEETSFSLPEVQVLDVADVTGSVLAALAVSHDGYTLPTPFKNSSTTNTPADVITKTLTNNIMINLCRGSREDTPSDDATPTSESFGAWRPSLTAEAAQSALESFQKELEREKNGEQVPDEEESSHIPLNYLKKVVKANVRSRSNEEVPGCTCRESATQNTSITAMLEGSMNDAPPSTAHQWCLMHRYAPTRARLRLQNEVAGCDCGVNTSVLLVTNISEERAPWAFINLQTFQNSKRATNHSLLYAADPRKGLVPPSLCPEETGAQIDAANSKSHEVKKNCIITPFYNDSSWRIDAAQCLSDDAGNGFIEANATSVLLPHYRRRRLLFVGDSVALTLFEALCHALQRADVSQYGHNNCSASRDKSASDFGALRTVTAAVSVVLNTTDEYQRSQQNRSAAIPVLWYMPTADDYTDSLQKIPAAVNATHLIISMTRGLLNFPNRYHERKPLARKDGLVANQSVVPFDINPKLTTHPFYREAALEREMLLDVMNDLLTLRQLVPGARMVVPLPPDALSPSVFQIRKGQRTDGNSFLERLWAQLPERTMYEDKNSDDQEKDSASPPSTVLNRAAMLTVCATAMLNEGWGPEIDIAVLPDLQHLSRTLNQHIEKEINTTEMSGEAAVMRARAEGAVEFEVKRLKRLSLFKYLKDFTGHFDLMQLTNDNKRLERAIFASNRKVITQYLLLREQFSRLLANELDLAPLLSNNLGEDKKKSSNSNKAKDSSIDTHDEQEDIKQKFVEQFLAEPTRTASDGVLAGNFLAVLMRRVCWEGTGQDENNDQLNFVADAVTGTEAEKDQSKKADVADDSDDKSYQNDEKMEMMKMFLEKRKIKLSRLQRELWSQRWYHRRYDKVHRVLWNVPIASKNATFLHPSEQQPKKIPE